MYQQLVLAGHTSTSVVEAAVAVVVVLVPLGRNIIPSRPLWIDANHTVRGCMWSIRARKRDCQSVAGSDQEMRV